MHSLNETVFIPFPLQNLEIPDIQNANDQKFWEIHRRMNQWVEGNRHCAKTYTEASELICHADKQTWIIFEVKISTSSLNEEKNLINKNTLKKIRAIWPSHRDDPMLNERIALLNTRHHVAMNELLPFIPLRPQGFSLNNLGIDKYYYYAQGELCDNECLLPFVRYLMNTLNSDELGTSYPIYQTIGQKTFILACALRSDLSPQEKLEAIDAYQNECLSLINPLWKSALKVLVVFVIAVTAVVLVAAVAGLIGFAAGAWTGPGAFISALFTAGTGAIIVIDTVLSLTGVLAGSLSGFLFFRDSEKDIAINCLTETARDDTCQIKDESFTIQYVA